jgi:hypothetical protein
VFYLRSGARVEMSSFGDSRFISNLRRVLVISCVVSESF